MLTLLVGDQPEFLPFERFFVRARNWYVPFRDELNDAVRVFTAVRNATNAVVPGFLTCTSNARVDGTVEMFDQRKVQPADDEPVAVKGTCTAPVMSGCTAQW